MNGSAVRNIELPPVVVAFEEATVVGEKSNRTESTDLGLESVDVEQIKALPALLGEVDVLKVLQFLPGVSSAGEGNSGFYVRGGGPDQNLILLDDATIYNASHLFGFFSVFNADAIKNVELIKGAMPCRIWRSGFICLEHRIERRQQQGMENGGRIGTHQFPINRGRPFAKRQEQHHSIRSANVHRRTHQTSVERNRL
jgi:hypothetical protein